MNLPTQKEIRWFVTELINIRLDTERTPNYIADIEFDFREILDHKFLFTTISNRADAQSKIKEMLYSIKDDGEFLNNFNNFDNDLLNWKTAGNGNIIIKGFQTGLLTAYLKERILKGEKVFSLTINTKKQQVIAVYGENTGKRIESGEQYLAFCFFKKCPNRLITYRELVDEFKRSLPHEADYYFLKCPDDQSKEDHVKTVVENLKRKLIEAGERYSIDIDKVLETVSKRGYISHM